MRTPTVAARAARKLVALLTVVSLLTPLTIARGAEGCGVTRDTWTVLDGPRFPAGPQRIIDLALDSRTPSRFFVTNGAVVMRTTDGGCSWEQSYVAGEEGSYTNPRITSVIVPEAGGRVLVSLAETVVNQSRPHVAVSFDAGRTWESGDAGLPPLGSPRQLVVASSSPDTVYLAVDLSGGTLDSIFASSDGGRTWEMRTNHIGGEFTGFEVDPIVPTELWAYGNGLHRSTDGGATWTPIDDFVGTQTGPVDVFHQRGSPSSIFVFTPATAGLQRSVDGGQTWLEAYGLNAPDSIDHGATEDSRVAIGAGQAYIWAPALFSWVNAQTPIGGLRDVNAARASSNSFFMRTASKIVVYTGATGADYEIESPEFVIGDITLTDPPDLPSSLESDPPELTPKKETVKIPLGEKKRVTYGLTLSKIRTPLDLYFLVDTSDSAKRFLKGLAQVLEDVVNRLYEARLDVEFGLAEYRAYPDSTPPRPECDGTDIPVVQDPQCERNFVYRQVLDVSPASHENLAEAIEGLEPAAGGHYNAPLPALYQTATGAGQDLFPAGPLGHDVPPGLEATFRAKAVKIVLNATDEEFDSPPYANDDNPPDVPTVDEVIAALNAKSIDQIGLALGPLAIEDFRRIASGTGAVAPSEGADCDGDGAADIAAGAALVCLVNNATLDQGANLVPAIVNMVEAVRDRVPVSLDVAAKDDEVIADVTPSEYPGVVLQADQKLKFDVTYTCPTSMAGEKTEVGLVANQGNRKLARAMTTVVCGKKPPKKPFFLSSPFETIVGILPLLPLAPPPTLANPSSATQAQSQAQAQSAMATQEQEQPQLAFVTQYKSALKEALAKEEEYSMSSYRDRTSGQPPPGLFLAGASLMMAAAYGVAMSRRRKAAFAPARQHRSRR